jgi:DnaJ-domain-containing protein 1
MGLLNLLIAGAIVMGAYWFLRTLANAPPAKVAGLIRQLGGLALIGLAGLLAIRGGYVAAVPLFVVGLGLMGYSEIARSSFDWSQRKQGRRSRVTTSLLAMELDHDTGAMDGEIVAGSFKGRRLSGLAESELKTLHAECSASADQSRALFEAWLDRTRPGWRDNWGAQRSKARPQPSTAMGRDEALAVLGLKSGATADAIRAAHRRLMKELHPDRGGSDYLAAKVNQAKDVLLQD